MIKKAKRGVGHPIIDPAKKRVQIAARVDPETLRYFQDEQDRTGQSLGRILDEAAKLHRDWVR